MINFKRLSDVRIVNIKRLNEYLLIRSIEGTLKYAYSLKVICAYNSEMFRRYGQIIN